MNFTKDNYTSFCKEWMEKKWNMGEATKELANRLSCTYDCARAINYLTDRSRGTESHIQRLIRMDRLAKMKNLTFDWSCVYRGEEDEEIVKFEWKIVENAIHKLVTTVPKSLYYDDSDEEKDKNRESRLENVKLALTLLPVLKDKCSSIYPVPDVYTLPEDGSIEFAWTNLQSHDRVTCSIRIQSKGREVDIAKYPTRSKPAFQTFSFTIDHRSNEDSIVKTLQSFLSVIF